MQVQSMAVLWHTLGKEVRPERPAVPSKDLDPPSQPPPFDLYEERRNPFGSYREYFGGNDYY